MSSSRRDVCLLAKVVERGESDLSASFGNVIELSEAELLLESARPLEPGDPISVSFYVPVAGTGVFIRVATQCEVGAVQDELKMLYQLRIEAIDEASRQHMAAYASAA